MIRRLTLALCLSVIASGVIAQDAAENIRIEYQTLSAADPTFAGFWQDYVREVSPNSPVTPRILASTMPTSNGGSFSVTMFVGGGTCGLNTCNVRVIEDGVVIADFPACDEPTGHELSADGTKLIACGQVYDFAEIRELQENGADPADLPTEITLP